VFVAACPDSLRIRKVTMTNAAQASGADKAGRYRLAAAAFVACLSTCASSASSEPSRSPSRTEYASLQSFSRDFGSKSTSGYFVSDTGKCFVTLTVIPKREGDSSLGQAGERVRLFLNPGQMAGLDSEEGQSVTFTCGKNAAALMVDRSASDALTAFKTHAPSNDAFTEIDWDVYRQW
jgi:hypothetical protein